MPEENAVLQINTSRRDPQSTLPSLSFFSRLWLWLLGPIFSRIKFFKKNVRLIKEYLEKGAVIHVIQYASYLEYLILNHFFIKHGLPTAAYPQESRINKILRKTLSVLRIQSQKPKSRPEKDVRPGEQYVLFLQRRGSFLSVRAERQIDELQRLIELQKSTGHAIFLMPEITIWTRRPVSMTRSYLDVFFGNSTNPGHLRRFIIFLRNFSQSFIRSGQPLCLNDWTSDEFAAHGKNPIKEMRWRLFQFFSEERSAVTGPMTKPRTWMLESVLNSQAVQEVISRIAAEENRSHESVSEEAARELDFMAADYKYSFILMACYTLRKTVRRLYSPVSVDEKGMDRVRDLLKKGSVVYVPSHKSHLDYLLWSYLLHDFGVYPPHIIAGENLAFWPMGYIFRRMGAIFIRRSFKGNRLYSTLLRTYLTRMLWEGFSQEFFIEGTRSRTGKLLPPKLGILSIYVDAYFQNTNRDLFFIPISHIYSKLIEQKSYARELAGGKKEKESTSSLLNILKVFKLQYGALYQHVGEPLSMREYLENKGLDPTDVNERTRKELIEEIGKEMVYRINQTATATPSAVLALALLATYRRGITYRNLLVRVKLILAHFRECKAPMSEFLDEKGGFLQEALDTLLKDGGIQKYSVGDETVYTVNVNQRSGLEYYKNNILHYFAPGAYLAIAFMSHGTDEVEIEIVKERTRFLTDLFDLEFIGSPLVDFESAFNDVVETFDGMGYLKKTSEGFFLRTEKSEHTLPFFKHLLLNFLESYWVVASSLVYLLNKRVNERKFLKKIMEDGKKMALIGELEYSEAYSKTNFQNAILYFERRGVIIRHEQFEDTTITVLPQKDMINNGKMKKLAKKRQVFLELTEEYENPDALKAIAEGIRFYLGRKVDAW